MVSDWQQHELDDFVQQTLPRPWALRSAARDIAESRIEWEPLGVPLRAVAFQWNGTALAPRGATAFVRDAHLEIRGLLLLDGVAQWVRDEIERDGVRGKLVSPSVLGLVSANGERFDVRCLVENATVRGFGPGSTTRVDLRVWDIRRINDGSRDRDTASLQVDWYIGAPTTFPYFRVTRRVRAEHFDRERHRRRDEVVHRFKNSPVVNARSESSSADYAVFSVDDGESVRVARVPSGFGEPRTNPAALERTPSPGSPVDEERADAILEALGFVFGRHPLRLGGSTFDESGAVIESLAIQPWGADAMHVAGQADSPAVPILRHGEGPAEQVIGNIVGRYLELRSSMALNDVVWFMWVALRMPLGMNLPVYAAGLEALRTAWFKSSRSKSGGTYLPAAAFRKTFERALLAARECAAGVIHGDKIVRRMENAFQMSSNERFPAFFAEIGLPVSDGEDAVIRARNVSAHGGKHGSEHQELALLGHGYRTLLNRCMLKVLGYEGQYIDYSVLGHPARPLSEPIGYRPVLAGGAPNRPSGKSSA